MPSVLLLLSENPQTILAVEEGLQFPELRVRAASSQEVAEKWLAVQQFDLVLIDAEMNQSFGFLEKAWEANPLASCGVLCLNERFAEEARVRLMGAEVFWGIDELQARAREVIQRAVDDRPLGVLVIDDLDAPRDIICMLVESLGYKKVTGVSRAKEALKILEANVNEYFCVLSDQNMPEVTGQELVQSIRSHCEVRHLPIVMLTAHASPENLLGCLEAGASGFLAKPINKEQLRKELLKARRMFLNFQSPRLCPPEKTHLLEEALGRLFERI